MVVTKAGQTGLELALEFKTALNRIEAGPSIKKMGEIYTEAEKQENVDTSLAAMYEKHFTLGMVSIFDLPIMKNNKFRCTKTLLYWVSQLSGQNVEMFSCFIGLLATLFYNKHYKTETMSIAWLIEEDMLKFVQSKNFIYWYFVAKTGKDERSTVFDEMTSEDFYSFKF